jgi:outer membrane protein assembly factor BamB
MKAHFAHTQTRTHRFNRPLAARSQLLIVLMLAVLYTAWPPGSSCSAQEAGPTPSLSDPVTNPYPLDALTPMYEQAAKYILEQTGYDKKKGHCFVFGAAQGRLAYEIARRSDLYVFATEQDQDSVHSAREALLNANMYGNRVTLHHGSLDKLRYNDYGAALVVSDTVISQGRCSGSAAEMFRMVRPHGGIALLGQPRGCPSKLERAHLEQWLTQGNLDYEISEDENGLWARIERRPLPGAGEWTKMWGDLGNTACSLDQRITGDWRVLWFGQPGPRILVERHARAMTDLYKNGKWVIPGAHRVTCVDAYNGARLWQLRLPDSSRVGINSDAGWVTLGENHVYVVAQDRCLKLDPDTGVQQDLFQCPTKDMDWGYVAVDGNLLFGSEQKKDASIIRGVGGNHWRSSHGDDRPVVTSTRLFCLNARSGQEIWSYEANSVIANPTICISHDAVFFMESQDPEALRAKDGRVPLAAFSAGKSEHIVKLSKHSGKRLWRKQYDLNVRHSLYLSCANGIILASGARTDQNYVYDLAGFKAENGALIWSKTGIDSGKANDSHGYQDKHPMIVGNSVYFKYGSFNLHTGDSLEFTFGSSNCSDFAASATHFFGRNQGCASIYSFADDGAARRLSPAIRPGCYISVIPAGGIIMLPAFSSGCTCDFPIQTTIAWQPQ